MTTLLFALACGPKNPTVGRDDKQRRHLDHTVLLEENPVSVVKPPPIEIGQRLSSVLESLLDIEHDQVQTLFLTRSHQASISGQRQRRVRCP